MITGNFAVDVCGVHTRVDYVIEPPEGTFKELLAEKDPKIQAFFK